jgi:uncharacterized protein (TIGR02996 family)
MHPESDALLDAIFDAPDDDTPRLVYADWLQEHGQPNYAEFIRLQCAAAREPLWSDAANRRWEEIGRVWARLDEEWWPATRDEWSCGLLDAVHFERGFLRDSCAMTYDHLVRYSNSCWPWLPLPVTTLQGDNAEAERELLAHPRLDRVRHLRFVEGDVRGDYWPLIWSPRLTNLEMLDLSNILTSPGGAEWLLTPGQWPGLREVRIKILDVARRRGLVAGCLSADVDESAQHLQQLRRRLEARFEKVVWLTSP